MCYWRYPELAYKIHNYFHFTWIWHCIFDWLNFKTSGSEKNLKCHKVWEWNFSVPDIENLKLTWNFTELSGEECCTVTAQTIISHLACSSIQTLRCIQGIARSHICQKGKLIIVKINNISTCDSFTNEILLMIHFISIILHIIPVAYNYKNN